MSTEDFLLVNLTIYWDVSTIIIECTLSDALQYACEYGYIEVAKELLNFNSIQISSAIDLCFQYDLSIEIIDLLLTPLKDKVYYIEFSKVIWFFRYNRILYNCMIKNRIGNLKYIIQKVLDSEM